MRYVWGVVMPVLVQVLVVWAVVVGTQGDGSFTGLGVYLLGLFAVPLTAIINAIYVYTQREKPAFLVVVKCWGLALLMPLLVALLAVIG